MKNNKIQWILGGIALLVLPLVLQYFGNAWVRIADLALLYVMLALGLNIVVGYAGLLDLGYVAFYAVGAYMFGLLASPHLAENFAWFAAQFPDGLHLSLWMVIPLALVVAACTGVVLGIPVLKLRGDYLAIVTLGFGEIIRIFLNNLDHPVNITNGPKGLGQIDSVKIFGLDLGKRLELTEALLQMEGNLVPFLHITATTENDGITSGVEIDGPATDPTVRFTSSPELPQEEVLAQLLFGQGLQNLSALQALQLANAVATLAGKGGEGVVSKLRKGFGLDNLDVKTDAAGEASLTAGKYLSKNIYSEVTVDQDGKSQINLNLDVTKSITLRAQTGSNGDAGIGIVVEKDY